MRSNAPGGREGGRPRRDGRRSVPLERPRGTSSTPGLFAAGLSVDRSSGPVRGGRASGSGGRSPRRAGAAAVSRPHRRPRTPRAGHRAEAGGRSVASRRDTPVSESYGAGLGAQRPGDELRA